MSGTDSSTQCIDFYQLLTAVNLKKKKKKQIGTSQFSKPVESEIHFYSVIHIVGPMSIFDLARSVRGAVKRSLAKGGRGRGGCFESFKNS